MSTNGNTESTSTAAETPPSTSINSEVPAVQLQESRDLSGDAEKARADFTKARSENRRAEMATKEALKAEIAAKNLKNRVAEITDAQAKYEAGKTKVPGKTDAPETEAKGEEPKTDAPKTDESKTEKPKTDKTDRSVQTIAKQSQEIRALKEQLAKFETKAAPTVEDKAAFIAKVKADPSILFKEIDDPELLTKLAEIKYRDLTPEEKLKAELDAKIDAVNKKLEDAETAKKTAEHQAVDHQVYTSIAQILDKGLQDADGKTLIDAHKWQLCQKVTTAGEADAPRMAMNIATELTKDLGRKPTEAETQQILEIAFDTLEGTFRRKADVYRLDTPKEEPPKTDTVKGAKDQRPKTLNNRMASGGRVPTNLKPTLTTKAEREAYKDRLLQEHIRRSRAEASV